MEIAARGRNAIDFRAPMLDVWFDFASTYSYPAIMRCGALAKDAGVTLRFRPFLLGPLFKAQGWETSPFNLYPAKGRYMWRDLERICADLGLLFRKPDPFPQSSLLAARTALRALKEPWGEDFCRAVFHAQFAEGRRIDDPAVMRDLILARHGDAAGVLAATQSDEIKSALRAQTEEAGRIGIFGAPVFVTGDGELFWGNDRLEQALVWAKKAG